MSEGASFMIGRLALASTLAIAVLAGWADARAQAITFSAGQAATKPAQRPYVRAPQKLRGSARGARAPMPPVHVPRQVDIYQGYPQVNIR
jgi:hypothetical protein